MCLCCFAGLSGCAALWLSVWTSADATAFPDVLYYLGIYAALTMGAMALVFGRAFTWAGIVVRAAGRKPPHCRWTLLRFPKVPSESLARRYPHAAAEPCASLPAGVLRHHANGSHPQPLRA